MLGLGGDKKNTVHATLYKADDEGQPLYEATGQWSDELEFKDMRTNQVVARHDTHVSDSAPMTVSPIQSQDPWESQRAWSGIISALQAGDMQATSDAKSVIEEGQREMRRKEQTEKTEWQAKFFSRVKDDEVFERLAGVRGEELRADETNGVWKFDKEKAKKAKKPYHGNLTPSGAEYEEST